MLYHSYIESTVFQINDDLIVEIIKKMPGLKAYNYYGDEFEVQRTPP